MHNQKLLTQVSFCMLLALSLKPRHGYELMKQIEVDSGGRIKLGPGALYGNIKELRQAGLIEELSATTSEQRRRYYQLTAKGRGRLQQEITYFRETVKIAEQRNLIIKTNEGTVS